MNNYHIYQEQAKGKYSVIFKARKKKRLQFVAIKRLQKTRKAKVYNQARILTELNGHNNIIRFFDFMQTKNHMWEITEYCPGGDLLKIIQYDKLLPQNTVRGFALQIMAGMQYAHSKDIVICDIKPASILINQYGSVKIGDFGAAQKLVDLMSKSKGKKKGTPSYMAPELFQVNGVYSFQSDLWALGCMLYQLGQGNPPFVSTNFQEIAELARTAPTPKIDNFSSDFNNLLFRLLQKDPWNRISWKQVILHPWIRNQLPQLEIPVQNHFLQYVEERNKCKIQQLRVSHNLQNQNYGNSENMMANNRRQIFQFQNYNQEGEGNMQQNQYLQQQERMQQVQRNINNIEVVNMKKNKGQQDGNKGANYNKKGQQNGNRNDNKKGKPQERPLPEGKKPQGSLLEDSLNINLFLQALTSKPSVPLEQAIGHQSDTAVKPIIGNKDIQRIQPSAFNKKQLGFPYIQPQILAEGIVNNQMDEELRKILQGMKGEEKANVLGYFYTIVQNSQVANYLFRADYIQYYMSLLKSYKLSALRAKICEILGLLIRHATTIDSEILKYGIIPGFVDTVTKDKSEKVRRKAMAALGQLLFYGATQVDQEANEWDIPLSLISTLLKIMKNTAQDQIVRIYCCKSIQNITAQAQKVGLNFSQIDTLIVMITSFNTTKNEGFRTSIMSSIHHMISLNQTLRDIFLQKMPLPLLIQAFYDQEVSSKTLQIILWIILQQLQKSPKSKQSRALYESKELVKAIFSSIQNGSSVVKGRAYLFIYFLLNHDFKKITQLTQSKLFHSIERHGKQTGKFQSQALQFVVATLYQHFPLILKLCTQQLQSVALSPFASNSSVQKSTYITLIYQMQSCVIFQQLFNCQQTIQQLLNFFNFVQASSNKKQENKSTSDRRPYIEHFKNHHFMILEKIFTNQSTTQKLQQMYCASIVPFLIGKLFKTQQNDIRYSCIKYLIYLINYCLSQEFLYDSTILTTTSAKISSLIISHLIPELDILVEQGQVVANMMFKLMAEVFKGRKQFVQKYWLSCNLQKLLCYFIDNPTINVLRTVEQVFAVPISAGQMQGVIDRFLTNAVKLLRMYQNSGQQLFLQYPLAIITNILSTQPHIKLQKPQIDVVFQHAVILQSHEDLLVRAKAEKLLQSLLQKNLYSQKGLQDWKNLSKKGILNYQNFTNLSGLKANLKPTQLGKAQKQSRYNS